MNTVNFSPVKDNKLESEVSPSAIREIAAGVMEHLREDLGDPDKILQVAVVGDFIYIHATVALFAFERVNDTDWNLVLNESSAPTRGNMAELLMKLYCLPNGVYKK